MHGIKDLTELLYYANIFFLFKLIAEHIALSTLFS